MVKKASSPPPAAKSADTAAPPNAAAAWKVSKRSIECVGCGKVFEDGAYLFTSLQAGDATLQRVDRCGLCHQRRERGAAEIIWRTRFHAGPKKAKLDLAALLEVFRQLMERPEPGLRDLRFLVTLLLIRQRKLRLVRTYAQGSRDFLAVAYPRHRNTMDVEVSDLPKERIDALRAQLMTLFEGGELSLATENAPTAEAEGATETAPAESPAESASEPASDAPVESAAE